MQRASRRAVAQRSVVGANGKTGREVVYQSLKSGKNVVGLVRSNKPIFIPPGSAQTDGLSTRVEIEEHYYLHNYNAKAGILNSS